ncbi:MAG: GspE/PulE/PilB domain-containing protein [Polyangiales bacterium]
MATVSSIVVRRRLATMRQVEDALARQTLYGGDVVTNLLEVAPPPATDEAALTAALAEALELPAADAVALRSPDAAAVARVPRDLAERHGFVPIAVREGSVVVALAEPLSEAAVEEVSTALGATVRQEAAPIVRLRQALERAYGVAMDRRTRRLASILDGGDTKQSVPPPRRSLIPDVPDDPLHIAPAPKPVAIKEAVPEAHPEASPTPATTIRSAKPGADALRWFAKAARDAAPKKRDSSPRMSAAGRRRRGPFTRADAEKVFADPESTDAVLGALLEFAQQFFSFVALFLVQEEVAEGWDALGAGASGDRVRKMGVPLDLPSAFSEARETRAAVLRPRKKDGLDEVLATDLERPMAGDLVVVPVVVGKRVVALLYADDAGEKVMRDEVADVFSLAVEAGAALARVIVRKKKGRDAPVPRVTDPEVVAERAGILAKALTEPKKPSRPPADFEPTPLVPQVVPAAAIESTREPPPVTAEAETVPEKKRTTVPVEKRKSTPAMEALDAFAAANASTAVKAPDRLPADFAPSAAGKAVVAASLEPIVAPRRPTDPMGPPAEEALELVRVTQQIPALRDLENEVETPTMRLPSQPGADSEPPIPQPSQPARSEPKTPISIVAPTPPPPNLIGRKALGPIIPREEPSIEAAKPVATPATTDPEAIETSDVSDDELEELLSLADRSNNVGPPSRESERVEVYPARPPPRPSLQNLERELPKVMVAIEPEYVGLVAKVIKGGDAGDKAAAELRQHGVGALPAIMDRFPGPTRFDRTTPIHQIPPPGKAGPLLALLVNIGRLAIRDILARMGDPLPETRFWAVWLLTEIIDGESAEPIVPRLVDDDLAVRRAAWVAARSLLSRVPAVADTLIEPLVGVVLDPGGGTSLRIRSANALGELRDRRAVEGLIFGLEAREPELAAACHEALVVITRHDPVKQGRTWSSWFASHGMSARIEWLIEALLEEDMALREAAAAELKETTKVYFGYYANLPRAEREQAYRRYRTWWQEEGHRRFEGRP